jgi:hypothetical protein
MSLLGNKMMISLMEGLYAILIVFSDERIGGSASIPISLPPWSMANMVAVEPHIPSNKKELSDNHHCPSPAVLLASDRLEVSVLNQSSVQSLCFVFPVSVVVIRPIYFEVFSIFFLTVLT